MYYVCIYRESSPLQNYMYIHGRQAKSMYIRVEYRTRLPALWVRHAVLIEQRHLSGHAAPMQPAHGQGFTLIPS